MILTRIWYYCANTSPHEANCIQVLIVDIIIIDNQVRPIFHSLVRLFHKSIRVMHIEIWRWLGSHVFISDEMRTLMPTAAWWRHQMETFSALLAICAGNSPVSGEFPAQRPVTRSFDVFFDLRLNKRLSKQRWGWWSETPSDPLWRHCNGYPGNGWVIISHGILWDVIIYPFHR